jgi:hypothetical protein
MHTTCQNDACYPNVIFAPSFTLIPDWHGHCMVHWVGIGVEMALTTVRRKEQRIVTALLWVIVILVVLAILGAVAWSYSRKQRSERLRGQFGPEYDRTVQQYQDPASAEQVLEDRRVRVEHLQIRPLAPEERARYSNQWHDVQGRFVDDPAGAMQQADGLVNDVMLARGYPMGDFETRAADISVDHPQVVENYRTAHAIATRAQRGQASTEELRQAMVHYRALFADLLEANQIPNMEVRR